MRLLITTQAVDHDDPVLGFFHDWILEFSRHFSRIDVICLREGRHTLPSNVHVHSLGKESGHNRFKYFIRFYRFFGALFFVGRVDYVFYHMGAIYNILGFPFFLIRKLFSTKFFWWKTHGKVGEFKETLALLGVDQVFTAGAKSFDRKSDKIRVVGHAIDTDRFSENDNAIHSTPACLMVGRIVPVKKIEVALRALSHIGHETDVSLTLVGSPDSPLYQETLLEYSREHALSTVDFLGARKQIEMPSLYANAGILLHPAYDAGFDKAVLEAMASGVIPLTSIPSFEPVLRPYGLFIPAEDDKGYAGGILRIMRMSDAERKKLRETLRAIVVNEHSLTTLGRRIFGV